MLALPMWLSLVVSLRSGHPAPPPPPQMQQWMLWVRVASV